jgi:hypothetical protein
MVGGFFWFVVSPAVNLSIDRVLEEHVRMLAANAPDVETARRLGAPLGLEVRYEGPGGDWSTADDLPPIDFVAPRGLQGCSPCFVAAIIRSSVDRMADRTCSAGMCPQGWRAF